MSNAIIIGERCFDCSRVFSPLEMIHIGESVLKCQDCYHKQRAAVESWGDPPTHCQGCNTSFADLAAAVPGKPVSMFCHWKDGIFQLLCVACDQDYVQKRKDLYAETRFGWERKLK